MLRIGSIIFWGIIILFVAFKYEVKETAYVCDVSETDSDSDTSNNSRIIVVTKLFRSFVFWRKRAGDITVEFPNEIGLIRAFYLYRYGDNLIISEIGDEISVHKGSFSNADNKLILYADDNTQYTGICSQQ
jgi:hypothetical protein